MLDSVFYNNPHHFWLLCCNLNTFPEECSSCPVIISPNALACWAGRPNAFSTPSAPRSLPMKARGWNSCQSSQQPRMALAPQEGKGIGTDRHFPLLKVKESLSRRQKCYNSPVLFSCFFLSVMKLASSLQVMLPCNNFCRRDFYDCMFYFWTCFACFIHSDSGISTNNYILHNWLR